MIISIYVQYNSFLFVHVSVKVNSILHVTFNSDNYVFRLMTEVQEIDSPTLPPYGEIR
jgi:hypothetical protein